jgi:hypothetical protein
VVLSEERRIEESFAGFGGGEAARFLKALLDDLAQPN